MAVNPPRIVSEPVIERHRITGIPVPYAETQTDNFTPQPTEVAPPYEGALLVVFTTYGSTATEANMYIAVNLDGALTWVVVDTGNWLNGYSGDPWDSMANFPVG